MIAFHKNEADPSLWIYNDLMRLDFVYSNSNLPNRDELYLNQLKRLKQTAKGKAIYSSVLAAQADLLYQQGSSYDSFKSESLRLKWKEALALCEEAIATFPKSLGAQRCQELKLRIKEKSLQVKIEDVIPKGEPFPSLITYKNVKKVYWKVVKAQPELLEKEYEKSNQSDYNFIVKFYNRQAAIKQWETNLPDPGDYHNHSVEEKCPALDYGDYILMAADNPEFATDQNAVVLSNFTISNLSYIHRSLGDTGQLDVYVLHRKSGQALEGVKVNVSHRKYDYKKRKYNRVQLNTYQTDAQGYIRIPYQSVQSYDLDFSLGEDKLGNDGSNAIYVYRQKQQNPQSTIKTSLFLDRMIYRPGQTVYFKGIVMESLRGKHKIVPGHKSSLQFYDVNGQKVEELELTANEYGTYSGQFTAPDNGLNGNMRIAAYTWVEQEEVIHTVKAKESLTRIARDYKVQVADIKSANGLSGNEIKFGQKLKIPKKMPQHQEGSVSFSVEEYKRPKFFVEIPAPEGSYKFEEEVTVTGNAKAYSGANIDGAEVTYRVVRRAYRPYWYGYYYRSYYNPPQETVILQGSSQTDDKGQFEIKFRAAPDLNFGKIDEQTCSYVVYADVTDINGETHSQSRSLVVSQRTLVIGVNLDNEWDQSGDIPTWYIQSNNLNGVYEASKGEISIRPVKKAEREIRERKWAWPDQFLYDKATWLSFFPHDAYGNPDEDKEKNLGSEVYRQPYNTETAKELKLEKLKSWEPGKYLLEIAAKDAFGQEVKSQHYFQIYNSQAKQVSTPNFFSFRSMKNQGEPGEKAIITLGT
ncbi:MAG: MG2 domain-containing protein, partial [Bacteroidota bacterium]